MQGQTPSGGAPSGGEGGGGSVGEAIVQADQILSKLAKSAPPEFADKLAQISEAFRGVVEEMMAAAEGGAPKGAPASQPASPEQGANPNARPAGF